MKLILSRKGFDTGSGGEPSPIWRLNNRLIPLPIPGGLRSRTRYMDLGIGAIVERVTDGRVQARHHCHNDPMFENGRCAFGQTAASQSHLNNQGVGVGDLFLFWGLYQPWPRAGGKRAGWHHRIFGCLTVEEVRTLGPRPSESDQPEGFPHRHPHTLGAWDANNTLYLGAGDVAEHAAAEHRLTVPGEKRPSAWKIPRFFHTAGLSYHDNPKRPNRWRDCRDDPDSMHLMAVPRGQEFVCDLDRLETAERTIAERWIGRTLAVIRRPRQPNREGRVMKSDTAAMARFPDSGEKRQPNSDTVPRFLKGDAHRCCVDCVIGKPCCGCGQGDPAFARFARIEDRPAPPGAHCN